MKELEESAESALKLMFADRSAVTLVFNLFVIALLTGLAEELFFRGCLQQIIQQIVTNSHVAVWVTAIIFSVLHFQFYGFVPRVLLGVVLGYVFVWSGSIWAPVVLHTIHNALNVILIYIYMDAPESGQVGEAAFTDNAVLVLASVVLSALTLFLLYRERLIKPKIGN
jgi:membrane protease YdiL (CAAX protease family)